MENAISKLKIKKLKKTTEQVVENQNNNQIERTRNDRLNYNIEQQLDKLIVS